MEQEKMQGLQGIQWEEKQGQQNDILEIRQITSYPL